MPDFRICFLLAALAAAPATHAAESYDSCAGFIDALPAVISTQGTWCLRKDLSTAMTSGAAITIAANNVTIDCNNFKLGGIAAGPSSIAVGIGANGRINATVRHCAIRGFHWGIRLYDGANHLVEDNRLDNNLRVGVLVEGDGSLVRRNRVQDTGGPDINPVGISVKGSVDIEDNTVSNVVAPQASDSSAYGIVAFENYTGRIMRNTVRGLTPGTTVYIDPPLAIGIHVQTGGYVVVRDNVLFGMGPPGLGVICSDGGPRVGGNTIQGFDQAIVSCGNAGGNDIVP